MAYNQLYGLRVLIVDDERMIQRIVLDVLLHLGFKNITVANSGQKAIEHIKKEHFDFVISDWRMEDMDGIEIVRFVRHSPESPNPTLPIIMLTGNTEAHYVHTALKDGVNAYVIKPFSAEQLVKRIRGLIENPRAFVMAPDYRGPDRRHSKKEPPHHVERRKPPKPKPT